ncbi:MAG: 30S ribosomal protein S4 [Clostridiales bacterium]|nr:30S ribosomal protein S4 [Clostridiales bacterium]
MAKNTSPDCKQCRREGCKLFLKGERCLTKCAFDKRPVAPGPHATAKKKVSEYGVQLREKQKVRRAYGLLEKQFRNYYEKAAKGKESTGWALLKMLEMRLDNVVYRMGLGVSRTESRQIVNHGHITVNGKKVNIPSYQVKVGDVIAVKESKQSLEMFASLKGLKVNTPKWLEFNTDSLTGKVLALPERDDIDLGIQEHLIVEFYSR